MTDRNANYVRANMYLRAVLHQDRWEAGIDLRVQLSVEGATGGELEYRKETARHTLTRAVYGEVICRLFEVRKELHFAKMHANRAVYDLALGERFDKIDAILSQLGEELR